METEDMVRQLKLLKVWVAIGAIGFLLIGAAAFAFGVAAVLLATVAEKELEKESDFADRANEYFEKGQLEELERLISGRNTAYPNDGNVAWYRARLYAIRGDWKHALSNLDQTALLAPNWVDDYVDPLRKEVLRRQALKQPVE
jgi:hypothetical protein